jgi:hypothetical protein
MDLPVTTASEPPSIQSNRSEASGTHFYLIYFLLGAILYALSPGPVAKFLGPTKPPGPDAVLRTAYAPIGLCCACFLGINRFYEWYMRDLWHVP